MSPHFVLPPPPPSYPLLLFRCTSLFCSCFPASYFPHEMTHLSHPVLSYIHFLHLQMRCGINASFTSGCIWHGDSPASAKRDNSTVLSHCQTCCCYPPCWLKMRCFYITGEDRRTGNEPMHIIHPSFLTMLLCFRVQRKGRKHPRTCINWRLEDRARFVSECAALKVSFGKWIIAVFTYFYT